MNDTRQSLRLVRPRASAQGKLPPPPPPTLLPVYEEHKSSGLTVVFREYANRQEEYNRKLAAWFSQQQQAEVPSTSQSQTTTPAPGLSLADVQVLITSTVDYWRPVVTSKAPQSRRVDTTGSIEGGGDLTEDRALRLVNDSENPGPNKQYATDSSGNRGWFPPGAAAQFTHSQGTPQATWTVNHNLGFRPQVVVEDLSGQTMLADVQNVGNGFAALEIRFGSPTAGLAYLS